MRIAPAKDTELEDRFSEYVEAKRLADHAISQLDQAEAALLKVMEAKQRKTVTVESEEKKISATYTQRMSAVIDEVGLKKRLGARVFNKHTVRKLDRKSLEAAMERGEVDPHVVAMYVDNVPGKTYLTYRVRDKHDSAES